MFSKMYGKPKIPSNSENNGKRWYHTDYNVEGVTKMISINLLMNPSDKQSKLVIQSAKNLMTMMWFQSRVFLGKERIAVYK